MLIDVRVSVTHAKLSSLKKEGHKSLSSCALL